MSTFNTLKKYQATITVQTPIHIGSGNTLSAKEYILLKDQKRPTVIVPNLYDLYENLKQKKLDIEYEDFLLDSEQKSLYQWLKLKKFTKTDYEKISLYYMPFESKANLREIHTFIKDGTNSPYIPGSSIKGVIRTCLLNYLISEHKDSLISNINATKENIDNLEIEFFNTLNRKDVKKNNAVNSNLSGLLISDSNALKLSDLSLSCIERLTVKGKQPALFFNETLKTNTKINFSITINTQICPYSINDIKNAISYTSNLVYTRFYSKFKELNITKFQDNNIFLGACTGFSNKTVLNALYPNEMDAIKATINVFNTTLSRTNKERHQHHKDIEYGVSPHTCLVVQAGGRYVPLGKTCIEFEEI